MEIRKLSGCVLFLLLFLPQPSTASSSSSNADHPLSRLPRKRVKRISTPYFEFGKTLDMAKYVVSLRSRTPRKYFGDNHYCGGVIISRTFILTAAHCTMDRKIEHRARVLLVVAGTPNRLGPIRGIVLIGVNNPHLSLDEIKRDYVLCEDVSDRISWLSWKKTDISAGYSYACEVAEFRKRVDHLPQFSVSGLLL